MSFFECSTCDVYVSDINECRGNHSCHQICVNTRGSFFCKCSPGYEFGPDNKTCIGKSFSLFEFTKRVAIKQEYTVQTTSSITRHGTTA